MRLETSRPPDQQRSSERLRQWTRSTIPFRRGEPPPPVEGELVRVDVAGDPVGSSSVLPPSGSRTGVVAAIAARRCWVVDGGVVPTPRHLDRGVTPARPPGYPITGGTPVPGWMQVGHHSSRSAFQSPLRARLFIRPRWASEARDAADDSSLCPAHFCNAAACSARP